MNSVDQHSLATGGPAGDDCEYAPLLSVFHDGELADGDAARLQQHLTECATCAREATAYRQFSGTFNDAPLPPLMFDRREALIAAAMRQGAAPAEPRHLRYVRRISAVAAAVCVLAVGGIIYRQTTSSPGTGGDPNLKQTDHHQDVSQDDPALHPAPLHPDDPQPSSATPTD